MNVGSSYSLFVWHVIETIKNWTSFDDSRAMYKKYTRKDTSESNLLFISPILLEECSLASPICRFKEGVLRGIHEDKTNAKNVHRFSYASILLLLRRRTGGHWATSDLYVTLKVIVGRNRQRFMHVLQNQLTEVCAARHIDNPHQTRMKVSD